MKVAIILTDPIFYLLVISLISLIWMVVSFNNVTLYQIVPMQFSQGNRDKAEQAFIHLRGKFKQWMLDTKAFLDPTLTVETLASDLNISDKEFGQFQQVLGGDFQSFVNELRVKEAQRLLKDPYYKSYPLTSISLASGFNSFDAFVQTFKQYTGMTPTNVMK